MLPKGRVRWSCVTQSDPHGRAWRLASEQGCLRRHLCYAAGGDGLPAEVAEDDLDRPAECLLHRCARDMPAMLRRRSLRMDSEQWSGETHREHHSTHHRVRTFNQYTLCLLIHAGRHTCKAEPASA